MSPDDPTAPTPADPGARGASEAVAATADAPVLRVLAGHPDATELAALTAVLVALGAPAQPSATGPAATGTAGWSAHWRRLGTAPPPGPDTWRMSAR